MHAILSRHVNMHNTHTVQQFATSVNPQNLDESCTSFSGSDTPGAVQLCGALFIVRRGLDVFAVRKRPDLRLVIAKAVFVQGRRRQPNPSPDPRQR